MKNTEMFFKSNTFSKKIFFFFFFSVICFSGFSQPKTRVYLDDPKAGARPGNFNTEHLLLEVSFEPEQGLVKGKVTQTFIPLQKITDTLFFDAPGIKILSAQLDKKKVEFTTNQDGVTIRPAQALTWNTKHTLTIEYEATPRKGIYFIGWNVPEKRGSPDPYASRKQIWTQGQGTDNRYWIPCFDDMNDKMTTELKVTFHQDYRVLSNGVLVEEKKLSGNNKLWHYKMEQPHPPYLIMLGIGKYDVKTYKTKSGITLDKWYYPEFPERVEPTYRYSVEMMDWMEKEFGVPYPWGKKYAQIPVQDFMYGAMENTTATVFGDFYFIDKNAFLDRNYVGTNAHELAHQWFGNYVTARAGEGTWLQESFATHYQKHFERTVYGEDYYQWNRRREMESVWRAAKRDNHPIVHNSAGSERVYPKGSLVLDMLKSVLGVEQYNRAQTHYLKKHAYQNVDTHDFYIAFLESSGVNLDWFFEQWLYRGGEPVYDVRHEELSDAQGNKFTRFTVRQTQEVNQLTGLFKMPVWLEVHYADGTSDRKQEWFSEQTQTVDIPNAAGKKVDYVLFDPNFEIIKTVNFPKNADMLLAQAEKAKNMIDRHDAFLALSAHPFERKKDFLLRALDHEPFFANRVEVVKQLLSRAAGLEPAVIKKMLSDKHSRVREAAVQHIHDIPEELLPDYQKLLRDSSYNVIETTLSKLCELFPEKTDLFLGVTENVIGNGYSVKIRWLEIKSGIARNNVVPEIVELAGPAYEFRTRANAMDALKRLNHLDNILIAHLFDACFNPNRRLAVPAKSLLRHFMQQSLYKKMVEDYFSKNEFEPWQVGMVSDLF